MNPNAVEVVGDGVQIGNAALGLSGSISKNYMLPIYVSKIHAVLAITNNTVWVPGTKCKLLVQTQRVPENAAAACVWSTSMIQPRDPRW